MVFKIILVGNIIPKSSQIEHKSNSKLNMSVKTNAQTIIYVSKKSNVTFSKVSLLKIQQFIQLFCLFIRLPFIWEAHAEFHNVFKIYMNIKILNNLYFEESFVSFSLTSES